MKRWKRFLLAAILGAGGVTALGYWLLPRHFAEDTTASTAWHHRSASHGYWVSLPSSEWGLDKAAESDVGFQNPKHSARVAVRVQPKRPDGFEKAIADWEAFQQQPTPDKVVSSRNERGTTRFGHAYYLSQRELLTPEGRRVWLAVGFVNLTERGPVVSVLFEALMSMQSQTGQAQEMQWLDNATRFICLSPREVESPAKGQ